MQGAIRARLLAAAPVTALAGARIYWVDRPQGDALPAVTLQIVSDPRPQHLKGFQDLRATRVQVDIWAAGYAQKTALAEAVIAAIVPEATGNGIRFDRTLVDAVRDLGDNSGTDFIHRTTIDLIVWWSTEG